MGERLHFIRAKAAVHSNFVLQSNCSTYSKFAQGAEICQGRTWEKIIVNIGTCSHHRAESTRGRG